MDKSYAGNSVWLRLFNGEPLRDAIVYVIHRHKPYTDSFETEDEIPRCFTTEHKAAVDKLFEQECELVVRRRDMAFDYFATVQMANIPGVDYPKRVFVDESDARADEE